MRSIPMLMLMAAASSASAADAPAPPPPISQMFGDKISAMLKEPVDGAAVADGVPLGIVKIVEWKHRSERPDQKAKSVEREVTTWRALTKKFDDAWAAYQARAAEVKAAVERSDQLLKDGRPDEARKAAEAVITPNKVSAAGQVDVHRAILDPRDAELPALLALGRAAQAQKDFLAVANLAQMVYAHRLVGAEADERLLWLARQNRNQLEHLVLNSEVVPALIQRADAEARKLQSLGRGMIATLFKLGLKEAFLYNAKGVKKGDWIVFQIDPQKIDARSATFSEHKTYQVPYDCVQTNKILAIDPSDGRVIWEERCQYRDETVNLDVSIHFAAPPPPWVEPRDVVHFIGRVDKAGPRWIISEAAVPDWRFIGFAPDDYFIISR